MNSYQSVTHPGLKSEQTDPTTPGIGKQPRVSPQINKPHVNIGLTKDNQAGEMPVDLTRKSSSPRRKYKCVHCSQHFATESLKLIHVSLEHYHVSPEHSSKVKEDRKKDKWKCNFCSACFVTEGLKGIHMSIYHSSKVKSSTQGTASSPNQVTSDKMGAQVGSFFTKDTGGAPEYLTQNISVSGEHWNPYPNHKPPLEKENYAMFSPTKQVRKKRVTSPTERAKHKPSFSFLKCEICRFKCKSDSLLAMHVKIHHSKNLRVIQNPPPKSEEGSQASKSEGVSQDLMPVTSQEAHVYIDVAESPVTAGRIESYPPSTAITQTLSQDSGCPESPGSHSLETKDSLNPSESGRSASADDNFIQSLVVPDPVFGGFKEIRLYKPPDYNKSNEPDVNVGHSKESETAVAKSVMTNDEDDVIDISDDSNDDIRRSDQSKKSSNFSTSPNPTCTVHWGPNSAAEKSTHSEKSEATVFRGDGELFSENVVIIKPMFSPKSTSSGKGNDVMVHSDVNSDSSSGDGALNKSLPKICPPQKRKSDSFGEDLRQKVWKLSPSSRDPKICDESVSNPPCDELKLPLNNNIIDANEEDSLHSDSSLFFLSSPKVSLEDDIKSRAKSKTYKTQIVSTCEMQGLPENDEEEDEDDRPIFSWNNPDVPDQSIPTDLEIQVTHSKTNKVTFPKSCESSQTSSEHSPDTAEPNEEIIDKLIHKIQEFSNVQDCTICDAHFSTNLELLAHVQGHSKLLRCLRCNLKFSNVIEINRHIQQSHIDKRDTRVLSGIQLEDKHFKCLHCDRSFTTDMGRKMHSKLVHSPKRARPS